ncbi:hypothetical protein BFP72_03820 [Reichenbachiella sp. 5M10]|nr:hypothetical protein BFP72_03820 [Reichenbachiella sp. 5M10]
MSQTIHQGLGAELATMTSAYNTKKLASKINGAFDESSKLSLAHISEDLVGFDLNDEKSFDEHVNIKLCIKAGSHKGHAIFHIPSFVPNNDIEVPEGATNFKIAARLVSVSDYMRKSDAFEMISPNADGKRGSFQSPMLPILKTSTQPMTSQLRLMESGPLSQNAATVLVIGVKFYQYEEKRFVPMENEAMISIRKVF